MLPSPPTWESGEIPKDRSIFSLTTASSVRGQLAYREGCQLVNAQV